MCILDGLVTPPKPGVHYEANHMLAALKEEATTFLKRVNASIERGELRIPFSWYKGLLGGMDTLTSRGVPNDPWYWWGREGCVYRTIVVAINKSGWRVETLYDSSGHYVMCLSPMKEGERQWDRYHPICPECGFDPCCCSEADREARLFF